MRKIIALLTALLFSTPAFAETVTPPTVVQTSSTAWVPADASGAALTFTQVLSFYSITGNNVTGTLSVLFPTTASTAAITISGWPFTVPAGIYASGLYSTCRGSGTVALQMALAGSSVTVVNPATLAAIQNVAMTGARLVCQFSYSNS